MTQSELNQAVDRMMNDPKIKACMACNLASDDIVERHRPDSNVLSAEWRQHGDFWRCKVAILPNSGTDAAQVDLHCNGTIRTVIFIPCQLTVSQEEGFLCLSL